MQRGEVWEGKAVRSRVSTYKQGVNTETGLFTTCLAHSRCSVNSSALSLPLLLQGLWPPALVSAGGAVSSPRLDEP